MPASPNIDLNMMKQRLLQFIVHFVLAYVVGMFLHLGLQRLLGDEGASMNLFVTGFAIWWAASRATVKKQMDLLFILTVSVLAANTALLFFYWMPLIAPIFSYDHQPPVFGFSSSGFVLLMNFGVSLVVLRLTNGRWGFKRHRNTESQND